MDSRSPIRANVRVALVLAGLALTFFFAVIVNHLPS
jgi:hypothetical protein